MFSSARKWFIAAGLFSLAVALLHLVIIFVGAPGYRYFGAGEKMAQDAARGSLVPAAITAVITIIFLLWSAYAFSAAGVIRRLPLLTLGIYLIGAIYTLRGLVVIPQLMALLRTGVSTLYKDVVFSSVSLLIGICYLMGNAKRKSGG